MTKSSNSNPIWYNYTQISVQVVRDLIGISYDVLDGKNTEFLILNVKILNFVQACHLRAV